MTPLAAFTPRRLARLFVSDALNVSRDPTLIFAMVMSALPAVGFALGAGRLDAWAAAAWGVAGVSAWIAPVVLALPAALIGWVTGFLMLEDRDDGPLLALDVSPLGKEGFLAYRLIATMTVAALITLAAMPVVAPVSGPGAGAGVGLAIAAMVAMEAATLAIVLPAIASNKVEGLALTKVLNIFAFAPLLAAIPGPWRFLAAPLPGFWIGELGGFFAGPGLPVALTAALGLAVHLAVLVVVLRRLGHRRG